MSLPGYSPTRERVQVLWYYHQKDVCQYRCHLSENQPYYAHTHLQVENSSEASLWETIPLPASSLERMPSIFVQWPIHSPTPSSPLSSPLSRMPTQQLRGEDLQQQKLRVYSRRTDPRRTIQSSVHYQEPKPISIDLECTRNFYSSPVVDDLDLPITLGTGTRSYTLHPISNFVSYHRLPHSYKAFLSNMSNVVVPKLV